MEWRVRRPGITAKLFLAMLGVTLLVVVTMLVMARYTFREGFVAYVRDRQRERADAVVELLATYYADRGDWAGLGDPGQWRALLREAAWEPRRDDHPSEDDDHRAGREWNHDRDHDHDGAPPRAGRLVPATAWR